MTVSSRLTVPEFVARWQGTQLKERSAAQSHFIDLCRLLGQPTPTEADQQGSFYTFEKGVTKTGGEHGFADVWFRNHFGWEYKGPHKDLAEAYKQLLKYREDLENPPLLVVCDLEHFEVHTNFTGTTKRIYRFDLHDLAAGRPTATCPLPPLEVLRALFTDPERLRPQQTTAQVTEAAAAEFARLAGSLAARGVEPEPAAHFLMRLLFCLFAEDIGLLPDKLLTKLVEGTRTRPEEFRRRLALLFEAMANGGSFGVEDIRYFNGGLFADNTTFPLSAADLDVLLRAARLDWANVEPAIFGTLFERSLDPGKRAQLGAHYTSKDDILLIVEPVLMAPLRREWEAVQAEAEALAAKRDAATPGGPRTRAEQQLRSLLLGFSARLAGVRVLDPACGSGNFLYVALKQLLDLEKEVVTFALAHRLTAFFPSVSPDQLHGIEINPYARELAQVVVWIGYIQWLQDNGFGIPGDPILKPIETIEERDAILGRDEEGRLIEPPWPEADVIIGNPPFLGGKRLRTELGDEYVDELFALYRGKVPHEADLVSYWFERGREQIANGRAKRTGLLATQSIRAGANRRILAAIKETGDIFYAQSDRPWVLDGADVRVSMVGFDDGSDQHRLLNENTSDPASAALALAAAVPSINSNLTATLDITAARVLSENLHLCYMGDTKGGSFDITPDVAASLLAAPLNPNGRPNSDVVVPWVNGLDIVRRPRGMWIIDFGVAMLEDEAALYEVPFEYVRRFVWPERQRNNRRVYRERWWLHVEPRPAMRSALRHLSRYIATPRVARHRIFVFAPAGTLPDSRIFVVGRGDDYFFGILHSHAHEAWALATSSRHGVGNDPTYNNTTCFETFPFPWPPGSEPTGDPRVEAIAAAARELVEKRDRWLNPYGATEAELKRRTLTALYNERPTWLDLAHRKLDAAVLDAYGWPHDLSDEEILERLLALNLERAGAGEV